MGMIKETSTLVNQASSGFRAITDTVSTTNSAMENVRKASTQSTTLTMEVSNKLDKSLKEAAKSAALLDINLTKAIGKSTGATIASIREVKGIMEQINIILEQTVQKQQQQTKETEKTESKWKKLIGTIRNSDFISDSINLLKNIASAADQQAILNTRIAVMNDGLQSNEALQRKIYQSAQQSRTNYSDMVGMVGKFNALGPDVFSSSSETIDFTEQVNKHLALSGVSENDGDTAMLHLVQVLESGTIKGEELKSILAQIPTIADSIATYMGVNAVEMMKLANQGEVTSDVIKNALLATASDTNKRFSEMPMTFAQLWQIGMNTMQQAVAPILQTVAEGATLIYENWDMISPVLMGVAAAAGVVAISLGLQAAASWIAVSGLSALTTSLLSCPLTWIALAIGVVVALIYKWVQSVGGLSVAWLIVKDYVLSALSALQIGIMTASNAIHNCLDNMTLKCRTLGVNIANFMGDTKVSVLTSMEDMINGAIGLLNKFITFVNKIPGVAIDPIDEISIVAGVAAENEAKKAARLSELSKLQSKIESDAAAREAKLLEKKADDMAQKTKRLSEIAAVKAKSIEIGGDNDSIPNIPEYQGGDSSGYQKENILEYQGGDIDKVGSVGDVKNIEGSVNLSDEDIKMYRDLAERRYMANLELQTLAPQINVSIPESAAKNLTAQDIADKLKTILIEQAASHTAVAHG